ncbi:MAG: ATP-binding cassette domain-containing protein [Pseudomonadota bacterium]
MLEARAVTVALAGQTVLQEATLTLRPGTVTALIGPNGAGKSTLLGCLSGAIRPDAGSVCIDGDAMEGLSAADLGRRRAVLEQTPSAAAPFLIEALVELGIPRAIPPRDARQIVHQALAMVGLSGFQGRPIDRLSGGERHRAHMARALAQMAAGRQLGAGRWLLLDEPTASLDLSHQGAVLRAARKAAAEGAGVLAVLHDLSLASAMADRVVLMQAGRIVIEDVPAAVLSEEHLCPVYGVDLAIAEPRPGTRAIVPVL